jgi:diguanylate cyclase (GGDEF)-like protein
MSENRKNEENQWQSTQDRLAESNGLAVIVVDESSLDLTKSNNNSVCQVLYNSDEFAPECAKFCGRAFEWATEAEKPVEYKCYAGLNCLAVPVKEETKTLVAIVGRTFLKAEDYRKATERAIAGDWQKFPPTKFFENVLLSSSMRNLEKAAGQIENLSREEKGALLQIVENSQLIVDAQINGKTNEVQSPQSSDTEIAESETKKNRESQDIQKNDIERLIEQVHIAEDSVNDAEKFRRENNREAEEIGEWRSQLSSLLNLDYLQACELILNFVSRRYSVSSLAWLERRGNRFETVFALGKMQANQLQPSIAADDNRLLDAVKREIPLELCEQQSAEKTSACETIQLFPAVVGGEIRSALIIGDENLSRNAKRHIQRFCQTIAAQLEILRLREQLNKRDWLERAVQKFNKSVKEIDKNDFWLSITQVSAEMVQAERSSLLILDEKTNRLHAKAAIGKQADVIKKITANLGEKIAEKVLQIGNPLLVRDIRETEISPAPVESGYKSQSFISYPITLEQRKIGVLNFTDRASGENLSELDLEMLNAIMPQMSVLIDRALLKHKAGEYEQLSVTDGMTGLLNRLYLDERLPEEIRRSNREGFPMSFMMIDVDDFKSYNDSFGHPQGDAALKLVAYCLKETLRGADVAVRYGGEEFSILLPQTTLDEAAIIGERVREKVASTVFPNRPVTISVGIASCSSIECTAEEIKKHADDALYEAKRLGKNNVRIYKNLD